MDARTFDRLVANAARRPTRRATLRLLAGGVLGAWLSRRDVAPARAAQRPGSGQDGLVAAVPAAACAELGAACAIDDDCCVGYCGQDLICGCIQDSVRCYPSGYGGCCNGQPCNADGFCGACGQIGARCNSDIDCCQGNFPALCCFNGTVLDTVCTDVSTTGYVCPGDAPAPGGCLAGQTDCGGTCVDLNSHAGHCGACFNACPLGGACQGGICGGVICTDGRTDCGGTCVDLASDEFHCGACFNSCPLGGYCSGGFCGGLICEGDLVDCYGRCVDLDLDWQNCGACGQGCFEGAKCVGGTCFEEQGL